MLKAFFALHNLQVGISNFVPKAAFSVDLLIFTKPKHAFTSWNVHQCLEVDINSNLYDKSYKTTADISDYTNIQSIVRELHLNWKS